MAPIIKSEKESSGPGLQCRAIRSRYIAVKNLITGDEREISRIGSDKFKYIIHEVDSLHEHVHLPKQQVADAEGLLDLTNTLVAVIRAHNNGEITPSDFVNCVIRDFGRQNGADNVTKYEGINSVDWKYIGLAVSPVLKRLSGCRTMLGPMNLEMKQRKAVNRKRTIKHWQRDRPKELNDERDEDNNEKTETDKIMNIMFEILKKNRKIQLENLILNRNSFAQTVENLFALSFLVKDGRVEINVDENGVHLLSPRNAPSANAVLSGEVWFGHFVFRFDFKDWKLMMDNVGIGEEKMPHRIPRNVSCKSEPDSQVPETQPDVVMPSSFITEFCNNKWYSFPKKGRTKR